MTHPDVPPINFTVSAQARRGFDLTRQEFDRQSADPAAVVCIGWGRMTYHSGEVAENVVVSFYARSQYDEIADAIQRVCDIDVVFIPTPDDHRKFEGKILDFENDRGFFLRSA
jgi:hypothetical protein